MRGTKTFATPEERELLRLLAVQAKATPFQVLPGGGNPAVIARQVIREAINKLALGHDLPRIRGLYDILDTGEFLRPDGPKGEIVEEPEDGETERNPNGKGTDEA